MQATARLHRFPTATHSQRRVDAPQHSANAAPLKTLCCNCNLRDLCLPCGLDSVAAAGVNELDFTRRRIRSGEHLYRAGAGFSALYAVRSGFFRSSMTRESGELQVTGFSMAGDLMGMDGMETDKHSCSTVALEDSEVCVIPFAQLENMSREIPTLQRHLHRMMGREIMRDHGIMLLLGSMHAEERMATFLLNLSTRFAARGYSSTEFHLRMTREDIGSYLGLKLETVSRMLSRFQVQGLIEVRHREIEIKNLNGLKSVIGEYEIRKPPRNASTVKTTQRPPPSFETCAVEAPCAALVACAGSQV